MQFSVPQFIEYEAKIVGPLTFRQFLFFLVAGIISIILYKILPFSLFLLSALIVFGIAAALAFLRFGAKSLPAVLGNILKFNISPKTYLWRKKEVKMGVPGKQTEFKKEREKEGEEELPLKIAQKSLLKKLKSRIETKQR